MTLLSFKKEDISCYACSASDKDSVSNPVSAGCLVRNDQSQILLIKGTNGQWNYPSGSLDCNESSEQAAARETVEEASVTVTVGNKGCGDVDNNFIGFCCTENPAGQTPSIADCRSSEIAEVKYFTRAEFDALSDSELRFPGERQLLEDLADGVLC